MPDSEERQLLADNAIDDVSCYIYNCEDPNCQSPHVCLELNTDCGKVAFNVPKGVATKIIAVLSQSMVEAGLLQGKQLTEAEAIQVMGLRKSPSKTVN